MCWISEMGNIFWLEDPSVHFDLEICQGMARPACMQASNPELASSTRWVGSLFRGPVVT